MSLYRGTISFEPTRWPGRPAVKQKASDCEKEHWCKLNPERHREWKRKWREKNREHVLAYSREYYRLHLSKKAREAPL